jgi:hypothetical protein
MHTVFVTGGSLCNAIEGVEDTASAELNTGRSHLMTIPTEKATPDTGASESG